MRSIPDPLRRLALRAFFPVPARLARRFCSGDAAGRARIEEALREHFFQGWRDGQGLPAEQHRRDLHMHVDGRLELDRRTIIPWLDSLRPLAGLRILEIGCGTGSSTLALAEQGARVTGVDIDEGALVVARRRLEVHAQEAELLTANADALPDGLRARPFDLVIFFACLEHMTVPERLVALRDAWELLPAGGHMAVVDTPNRLWLVDHHTSLMPFFHWLPDDLAYACARFSPRAGFNDLYPPDQPLRLEHFLRRGRGVSFHEFDVALGPEARVRVAGCLHQRARLRRLLAMSGPERRHMRLLKCVMPGLHEAWRGEKLDLALEKPPA